MLIINKVYLFVVCLFMNLYHTSPHNMFRSYSMLREETVAQAAETEKNSGGMLELTQTYISYIRTTENGIKI